MFDEGHSMLVSVGTGCNPSARLQYAGEGGYKDLPAACQHDL